jgi:adenylosuccinate synthase
MPTLTNSQTLVTMLKVGNPALWKDLNATRNASKINPTLKLFINGRDVKTEVKTISVCMYE